jgi:protein-L-isoaspartate(D-aspartate) O-methyltransferase
MNAPVQSSNLSDAFALPRLRMVEKLKDYYRISDEPALEAMNRVPRHLFVPEAIQSQAYKDNALPISAGQTISQPFIVARMTELLELKALLLWLGYRNISFKTADGTEGWESYAPFDAVLVAAGGPDIPKPLVDQLIVGGKMVIPIGSDQKSQILVRVTRTETGFTKEDCGPCAFVPLIGEHGWQAKNQ